MVRVSPCHLFRACVMFQKLQYRLTLTLTHTFKNICCQYVSYPHTNAFRAWTLTYHCHQWQHCHTRTKQTDHFQKTFDSSTKTTRSLRLLSLMKSVTCGVILFSLFENILYLYTVVAKIIRTLTFSPAKNGFKSVISIISKMLQETYCKETF